jgi:hypothetical protein
LLPEMPELVVTFPTTTDARAGSTTATAGDAGSATGACERGGDEAGAGTAVSTTAGAGEGISSVGEGVSASLAVALTAPAEGALGSALRFAVELLEPEGRRC